MEIDKVNACSLIKIFITATRVRDGRARVFQCHEVTIDALLASACLPLLFPAVKIEDELYWDGGFMGNPALWPLIYQCRSPEVMLVQINPVERHEAPVTAMAIINRMNEITFNSSLLSELRAIDFVTRLLEKGHLDAEHYKKMNIHLIERPSQMLDLNASSKLNADWEFLKHLKALGWEAADRWLADNFDEIGHHGCDLKRTFFNPTAISHETLRKSDGAA